MSDLGTRHKWPAVAPVDGNLLAAQAVANAEALKAQRSSPDKAADVALTILADLSVAELFAKPHDELIEAAMMLASATRSWAHSLRSSGPHSNQWEQIVLALIVLVRGVAKGEAS